jgi:hypothetical protein
MPPVLVQTYRKRLAGGSHQPVRERDVPPPSLRRRSFSCCRRRCWFHYAHAAGPAPFDWASEKRAENRPVEPGQWTHMLAVRRCFCAAAASPSGWASPARVHGAFNAFTTRALWHSGRRTAAARSKRPPEGRGGRVARSECDGSSRFPGEMRAHHLHNVWDPLIHQPSVCAASKSSAPSSRNAATLSTKYTPYTLSSTNGPTHTPFHSPGPITRQKAPCRAGRRAGRRPRRSGRTRRPPCPSPTCARASGPSSRAPSAT